LWVEELSTHVHVQPGGDAAVDEVQEFAELDGPMMGSEVRDDLAGGDVEGGVEVGRAVAPGHA